MFSRAVLARSSPSILSMLLRTQVCSRALSTFHLARSSALRAAPPCTQRSFSSAPILRAEHRFTDEPEPRGTCFVGNLPFSVTAAQLKEAFSQFGNVEEVRLMTTERGLPRGSGFVKFVTVEDAVRFVDSHKVDPIFVLDRELHVNHARSRAFDSEVVPPSDTLMLGGFEGGEAEVRATFEQFEHDIVEVRVGENYDNGRPRRVFVQFHNVDQATTAMEALSGRLDHSSRELVIKYAKHRQNPKPLPGSITTRKSEYRGQRGQQGNEGN
ncbi:RNA-binding domain-containing protein [Gyrodon lividus]|nr:RNA-binding domain-containing protein [Gyrodon lividus]